MKKILKGLLIIILLVILAIGGFFGYMYFKNVNNRNPYTLVPDDAIFIIETKNLNDGWNAISTSKIWNHLKQNQYFADINESAASLDSLMKYNKTMDMLLSDRQMVVSAHMISPTDYNFLFVVDVQKAGQATFLMEAMNLFSDYSVTKRDYKGIEIIDMLDVKTKETLSFSFIDNLLVGSYTSSLLEKAIDQRDSEYWIKNKRFQLAKDETESSLFNFYVNYKTVPEYLKCYMSESSELVDALSETMAYTTLKCNLENERLSMVGYSNLYDSVPSYLNALLQVKPGKMTAFEIIPDNAALYMPMCFNDFNDFFEKLKEYYKSSDTTGYEDYNANIIKVEKFLKVNLKEDFFSWIGSEISFVKLQPESNAREEDVVVVIKAKNIDDAHAGLDHLLRQIKRRTPVKFEETEYKGYPINYLSVKGFFKMFLGKMFGKLEKPFFTYIGDYVVFSNSDSQLIDFIDSYSAGKTLEKNEAFMNFKNDFEDEANVTAFIQMPKIYQYLYFYGKESTRDSIKQNKDLLLSFVRIGFQLVSDGDMFKTSLITEHDPNALKDETLEKIERSAEELFFNEYDSLQFKVDLTGVPTSNNEPLTLYYNDKLVMSEGSVIDGKPNGVWKNYYQSGNLQSVIKYEEGFVSGHCVFYYDNADENIRAEMDFIQDEIHGDYKEYYENGKPKAWLEIKANLQDGDAEFYYDSGTIKAKGQYAEGLMDGKWKFYSETGQELGKKKFSEGVEKE
ncbi:MAG: DUF3352 domain-containing protein [Bacteroidia bacterium]|nr:DUF3352 domain-containing protein [Bacteroidia bacterium]